MNGRPGPEPRVPWPWSAAAIVLVAAVVPYLSTLDDYFTKDDFGVVQLIASKPWNYFPHWFTTSWMENIWGYLPDEVRPFVAVTYQWTTVAGAWSPVANHLLNVATHVANGWLVLFLALRVLRLGAAGATAAAVVFVLLPIQVESVVWITGRVDSAPAFFYLATFAAYVEWRQGEPRPARWYAASLALFFCALLSKQNTITMVGTLVACDVLIERRLPRPSPGPVAPYVPFVAFTLGYLALRWVLFHQVAREGQLNAEGLRLFGYAVRNHLERLVFGDVGAAPKRVMIAWGVAFVAAAVAAARGGVRGRVSPGAVVAFAVAWLVLGMAPILVAGYESTRHMYLASVGWAFVLGLVFDRLWRSGDARRRRLATVAAVVVLAWYLVVQQRSVAAWSTAADVSRRMTTDLQREAAAAPPGSLLIVGAPAESWEYSVPFVVQPPFSRDDLSTRVSFVMPMRLHARRPEWNLLTRQTLRRWLDREAGTRVVGLRWDRKTGAMARRSDDEDPVLRALVPVLLGTDTPEALDRAIQDALSAYVPDPSRR